MQEHERKEWDAQRIAHVTGKLFLWGLEAIFLSPTLLYGCVVSANGLAGMYPFLQIRLHRYCGDTILAFLIPRAATLAQAGTFILCGCLYVLLQLMFTAVLVNQTEEESARWNQRPYRYITVSMGAFFLLVDAILFFWGIRNRPADGLWLSAEAARPSAFTAFLVTSVYLCPVLCSPLFAVAIKHKWR